MMKKIYIAPKFLLVNINCRSLVAISTVDKFSTGGNNEVLVKEDNSGSWNTGSKSVWDNEW